MGGTRVGNKAVVSMIAFDGYFEEGWLKEMGQESVPAYENI